MTKTKTKTFGEILRGLRVDAGHSLRKFAKLVGMQPSNLSFIENDRVNPPREKEILFRLAKALMLKKGSKEWGLFFDSAAQDMDDRIPADIADDRALRSYLPVMLRAVEKKQLNKKEMQQLIDRIRTFKPKP